MVLSIYVLHGTGFFSSRHVGGWWVVIETPRFTEVMYYDIVTSLKVRLSRTPQLSSSKFSV